MVSSPNFLKLQRNLIKNQPHAPLTQRWSSREVLEEVLPSGVSGMREGLCRPRKREQSLPFLKFSDFQTFTNKKLTEYQKLYVQLKTIRSCSCLKNN